MNNNFSIGPRIIKTGVAVAISIIIAERFGLAMSFFAGVSAILAMQPSITKSFSFIKEILMGNAVAIIFALAALYFFGNHPVWVGIAVISAIAVNVSLGMTKTINLSVFTMIILMMTSDGSFNTEYVLNRLSLVGVGITVSILVNVILFPPKHKEALYEMIHGNNETASMLLKASTSKTIKVPKMKSEVEGLEKSIEKTQENLRLFLDDRKKVVFKDSWSELKEMIVYKRMVRVLKRQLRLIKSVNVFLKRSSERDVNFIEKIKKLTLQLTLFNENLLLLYENKVELDKKLQSETKKYTKQIIESTLEEIKGYDIETMSYVLPITNNIMEYFYELDRLEMAVKRTKRSEKKKKKLISFF